MVLAGRRAEPLEVTVNDPLSDPPILVGHLRLVQWRPAFQFTLGPA